MQNRGSRAHCHVDPCRFRRRRRGGKNGGNRDVHTDSGFYLDENRKAEVLIKCENLAENILADPSFYPLLGYLAGHNAGNKVIAIEGKIIHRGSAWLRQ